MIHATADESFASSARIGAGAVDGAVAALRRGVAVDLRHPHGHGRDAGLATARCFLDRVPSAPPGGTRSAAGIEMAAAEHPDGALWVIGNAPTALARLLELHADGAGAARRRDRAARRLRRRGRGQGRAVELAAAAARHHQRGLPGRQPGGRGRRQRPGPLAAVAALGDAGPRLGCVSADLDASKYHLVYFCGPEVTRIYPEVAGVSRSGRPPRPAPACRSAGSGEENDSRSPVTGWSKASVAACRKWRSGRQRVPAGRRLAAVAAVADDRMADGRQVHPDLVGAPGLQPAAQQGGRLGPVVAPLDLVVGPGRAAAGLDPHPGGVAVGPSERGVDQAGVGRRPSRRPAPGTRGRPGGRPAGRSARSGPPGSGRPSATRMFPCRAGGRCPAGRSAAAARRRRQRARPGRETGPAAPAPGSASDSRRPDGRPGPRACRRR